MAAVVIRDPPRLRAGVEADTGEDEAAVEDGGSGRTYRWHETVRTWQFWLLYAVFVALTGVGLMVIGKAVALATALELSAAAATGSASVIALADSAGILVGGAVSDRFRREHTAGAALALTGIALAGAVALGVRGSAVGFVALLGAAAFFRSPAFAIFPVLVGEYYGQRHSSTNYAALFTAKLWGGLLGGTVASTLVVGLGWSETFLVAAGVAVVAGLATLALGPP
ncbi:MAG: MFS transporter [Halobacteriales archaeon]|nr:MFS transporter [Halobacteriales archaeon]